MGHIEINAYGPPIARSWAFLGIALERSLREEKMVAPMVITPLKASPKTIYVLGLLTKKAVFLKLDNNVK